MFEMENRKEPVIGIVGGMGPQAGAALFNSILQHTKAATDQEHYSVILMSFPGRIADRTAFLEGNTRSNPAYPIAEVLRQLEKAGATVAGIACNTSYCQGIYEVILAELDRTDTRISLVNMPDATCASIRERYPAISRVGIMVTNGTYRSGIYREALLRRGYDVVSPGRRLQEEVIHPLIYDPIFGLKATPNIVSPQARLLAAKAMDFFYHNGAELVLLGCTDLSILQTEGILRGIPVADSTDALAVALIRKAKVYGTEIRL